MKKAKAPKPKKRAAESNSAGTAKMKALEDKLADLEAKMVKLAKFVEVLGTGLLSVQEDVDGFLGTKSKTAASGPGPTKPEQGVAKKRGSATLKDLIRAVEARLGM